MSLGTVLPIIAWWISTIPSRSLQLVSLAGTMDPMRPFALDPFFRPFLTDPFFRDLWHLLPRPVLFTTPTTVLIRKTSAMPFMEVKIALSVASLLVVAFCWYKNGREILGLISPPREDGRVMDAEASVVDEDEIEEEEKERVLREWETVCGPAPIIVALFSAAAPAAYSCSCFCPNAHWCVFFISIVFFGPASHLLWRPKPEVQDTPRGGICGPSHVECGRAVVPDGARGAERCLRERLQESRHRWEGGAHPLCS